MKPTNAIPESFAEKVAKYGTAALRCLPAELAHDIGMAMLERGYADRFLTQRSGVSLATLKTNIPGIGALAHPIGLAAGFDKNCRAPHSFAKMGFSFLEIGTVTPRAQPGNPKPRLFRLEDQRAIINRMGFNSDGSQTVHMRLKKLSWDHDAVPLGVNVGKNKETSIERALDDYLQTIQMFTGDARYFVVNLSSPNTPGLRDLASAEFLRALAQGLGQSRHMVWIKLDPDMEKQKFQSLIDVIAKEQFQGLLLSNTHRVEWPEAGGLSGHPLAILATQTLEWAYEVHKGSLPMIASGGILSGVDIFDRLSRGASAVQIYTALVYRGPWVVARMLLELSAEIKLRGFSSLQDVVNSKYKSES